jgi:hypothetical protein
MSTFALESEKAIWLPVAVVEGRSSVPAPKVSRWGDSVTRQSVGEMPTSQIFLLSARSAVKISRFWAVHMLGISTRLGVFVGLRTSGIPCLRRAAKAPVLTAGPSSRGATHQSHVSATFGFGSLSLKREFAFRPETKQGNGSRRGLAGAVLERRPWRQQHKSGWRRRTRSRCQQPSRQSNSRRVRTAASSLDPQSLWLRRQAAKRHRGHPRLGRSERQSAFRRGRRLARCHRLDRPSGGSPLLCPLAEARYRDCHRRFGPRRTQATFHPVTGRDQ